mgnify:CR=1 FL=1
MAERKGNIGARENKALAQTKGERTKMQNKAAFGSRIREPARHREHTGAMHPSGDLSGHLF